MAWPVGPARAVVSFNIFLNFVLASDRAATAAARRGGAFLDSRRRRAVSRQPRCGAAAARDRAPKVGSRRLKMRFIARRRTAGGDLIIDGAAVGDVESCAATRRHNFVRRVAAQTR